jgi:catechol 2,3-dioxygenase-like lactoylglutathione lyase family enzyme
MNKSNLVRKVLAASAILVFASGVHAQSADSSQAETPWRVGAWHHVTVGVADLDAALAVWIDLMGFEIRARREGADAGLARLWRIEPEDVERQAMVGTPGAENGFIHLVQFRDPAPPVRLGAEVFDLLPKNLDVFTRDLPRRVEELRAAGAHFRTDTYSEVKTASGSMFREIHMHGHDVTNIVFVESGGGQDAVYTGKGYSGVRQLIIIVPDAQEEVNFFASVFGMEQLSKSYFDGPSVEKMVGLPPGSALDVRIVGDRSTRFGLMEIVDYHGVEGTDRYAQARPKALGTLHVTYFVDDLESLKQSIAANGLAFEENPAIETLFGNGPSIEFLSPAGLRIEAHDSH